MKELKLIDPQIKNFTDFLYVNLIEARIILWILLLTVTFFALQIFELSLNETYENILKQTTEALIISILGFLSVFSVFLFFSIISFTRNRNVSISFKGSYIFYKGKAFKLSPHHVRKIGRNIVIVRVGSFRFFRIVYKNFRVIDEFFDELK